MEPLISVIVPVYQAEQYISRCINSLLNQTYRNVEILLIDDGSLDSSGSICDAYASSDSRVRVIHKENGGPSSARNTGLQAAIGDYISFVDSDDWLDPNLYMQVMAQHPFDLSIFGITYVDSHAPLTVNSPCTHPTSIDLKHASNIIEKLITSSLFGYTCNKIYRREVVAGQTFQSLPFREDLIFNLTAIQNLSAITLSPCCGYYYYQHPSSLLHTSYSGSVPRVSDIFTQLSIIHPMLSRETNKRLVDRITKHGLTDFIFKYIIKNEQLDDTEKKSEIVALLLNRSISHKIQFNMSDPFIFTFLFFCCKLHLPSIYFNIMKRVWSDV